MQNDIHIVALAQAQGEQERRELIREHYQKQAATGAIGPKNRSALVRAQSNGQATVHAVFGGQGNKHENYFEDLRTAYNTYRPLVEDFVDPLARALLELSLDRRAAGEYRHGLDVLAWLRHESCTPPAEYLNTAPVSFPLVGLLQLVQLTAVFVGLGCGPEDLPALFRGGFSAHSQGIVAAVAAAEATNWLDFQDAALKAVTILFWTGVRCQQAFLDDDDDEKTASSPMLAISGLPRNDFERAISEINSFLVEDARMVVSVVNSSSDFVVSGPRQTLAALVDALESMAGSSSSSSAAASALSGRRVRFLPAATVPCNSFLLANAVPMIEEDLRGVTVESASLRIPINEHVDGVDLRAASHNLVPTMIRLITSEPVDWSRSEFAGITHAVDFGPGSVDGAGVLVHRLSAGVGPRVLIASRLEVPADSEFGTITELFDHAESSSLIQDDTQAGKPLDDKAGLLIRPPPSCTETLARSFRIGSMTADELGALLSGGDEASSGWRKALFSSPTIVRDGAVVPNPVLKLISSAAADTVEIIDNRLSFHRNGDLILYVSRSSSSSSDDGGDYITVMPFTWVTANNNLISLAMKFEYVADLSVMREVTEDRDRRVYDVYRQLWLRDVADRAATEQGSPETNVFEACFVVDQARVDAFNNRVSARATHAAVNDRQPVPMDFAMVAAWKPISQALLQDPVQGDLLSLAHLSTSYEAAAAAAAAPGSEPPLRVGDELLARAYVASIAIDEATGGKTVEVACQILRRSGGGDVALTVRSRFLFRGRHHDDSSSVFSRAVDDRYEVELATAGDQAVLLSQPWFRPTAYQDLDGATLEFRVSTLSRGGGGGGRMSSHQTTGDVFLRSRDGGRLVHMAAISSHDDDTKTNPVISYLVRAGKPLNRVMKSKADEPAASNQTTTTLSLVIPDSRTDRDPSSPSTAAVNPRHSSPMFAALVDLPGTMARGVSCTAATRSLVEEHVSGDGWVMRRFDVDFTASAASLLPGDELRATLSTTTTTDTTTPAAARRTIHVAVASASTGSTVLTAEAVVENPAAAALLVKCSNNSPTAAAAAAARSPTFRRPRMVSIRRSFSRSRSSSSSSSSSPDHHHVPPVKPLDGYGFADPVAAVASATPTRGDRFRGSWDRWMGRVEVERAPGFGLGGVAAGIRV